MNDNYCIIKQYHETGNEYIVRGGLNFEDANDLLDELNERNIEPCDFFIGDDFDLSTDEEDYADTDTERENYRYIL